MVHVISIDSEPLMPTKRFGKVKKWLNNGEAKIVGRKPFTIQLLFTTGNIVQDKVSKVVSKIPTKTTIAELMLEVSAEIDILIKQIMYKAVSDLCSFVETKIMPKVKSQLEIVKSSKELETLSDFIMEFSNTDIDYNNRKESIETKKESTETKFNNNENDDEFSPFNSETFSYNEPKDDNGFIPLNDDVDDVDEDDNENDNSFIPLNDDKDNVEEEKHIFRSPDYAKEREEEEEAYRLNIERQLKIDLDSETLLKIDNLLANATIRAKDKEELRDRMIRSAKIKEGSISTPEEILLIAESNFREGIYESNDDYNYDDDDDDDDYLNDTPASSLDSESNNLESEITFTEEEKAKYSEIELKIMRQERELEIKKQNGFESVSDKIARYNAENGISYPETYNDLPDNF